MELVDCPVLVTAFRRPQFLEKCLAAVAKAQPRRVYVSIDGPRPNVPDDLVSVDGCHRVAQRFARHVDTEIVVAESNGGTGLGLLRGIDWFFDNEEYGMVIEEDLLISPESLSLAKRLLVKYRRSPDVGSVTLFNAVRPQHLMSPHAPVRLSHLPSSWYWGTWRDKWRARLDVAPEGWDHGADICRFFPDASPRFSKAIAYGFGNLSQEDLSTWEGLWTLTNWQQGWYTAVTNRNYVVSLGFDNSATHLNSRPAWFPEEIDELLPEVVGKDEARYEALADAWMSDQRFGWSVAKRLKRVVKRVLPDVLVAIYRRKSQKVMSTRRDSQPEGC